ncbi:hypothetical protein ACS3CU_001805 [Vibrio parahaemolyticus]
MNKKTILAVAALLLLNGCANRPLEGYELIQLKSFTECSSLPENSDKRNCIESTQRAIDLKQFKSCDNGTNQVTIGKCIKEKKKHHLVNKYPVCSDYFDKSKYPEGKQGSYERGLMCALRAEEFELTHSKYPSCINEMNSSFRGGFYAAAKCVADTKKRNKEEDKRVAKLKAFEASPEGIAKAKQDKIHAEKAEKHCTAVAIDYASKYNVGRFSYLFASVSARDGLYVCGAAYSRETVSGFSESVMIEFISNSNNGSYEAKRVG